MLLNGEVMIARRQKFQRVYDLRERVHPDWQDETPTGNRASLPLKRWNGRMP